MALDYAEQVVHQKKAKIKYESALLNDYVNEWRWVLKIKMGLFKFLLQDRHICINDNYFLFLVPARKEAK